MLSQVVKWVFSSVLLQTSKGASLYSGGGVEGDREEDVEVETVVVECPVIVVEAVLLAECPDADVVPPVDLQSKPISVRPCGA